MTTNIHVAVILAAGPGERLRGLSDLPKPLVLVDGVPLIERTVRSLRAGGVNEIIVVVGYRGQEIREACAHLPDVRFVDNPEWERNTGVSLLAAREAVAGRPFFLVMADHIYSPDVLIGLQAYQPNGHCYLGVDANVSRVYDLDGQIKVQLEGDQIVDLGRGLQKADAVDTRIALMSGRIFKALEHRPNPRLLDGLRLLAGQGRLRRHDIGGALWQDIDTPETLRHGEWLLNMYGEDLQPMPRQKALQQTISNPERTLAYVEGILAENAPNHYVLFNPGPVVTSPRVKSALVHHDVCHRDEGFSVLLQQLRLKLKRVFRGGPEHEVLLITGSGTSGMEAAISSTIPRDRKLLVVSNGAFGERFEEIAQLHRIEHTVLRYEWGQLVKAEDVSTLLQADPDIFGVVMCHHETSVGLINPVGEVGRICRANGRMFIVDAVASLGGEDLDVARDCIDVCISSANKCLHAISGVAMACVHKRVWSLIEDVAPRVYYLDLKRYRRYEVGMEQTPFTPAVSNFYALDAAVDEYLALGPGGRQRGYHRLNSWIRGELKTMGFTFFTESGHESRTILCIKVPTGVRFSDMYVEMRRRGYIIYGCKAHLKDKYFQIANMGELSDEQVNCFLGALRLVMAALRRRAREADEIQTSLPEFNVPSHSYQRAGR
ncbi:MAG: aminotransferase class V-fold PLP-dependent enzyme [bacterium]